jgi:hypothetical protein
MLKGKKILLLALIFLSCEKDPVDVENNNNPSDVEIVTFSEINESFQSQKSADPDSAALLRLISSEYNWNQNGTWDNSKSFAALFYHELHLDLTSFQSSSLDYGQLAFAGADFIRYEDVSGFIWYNHANFNNVEFTDDYKALVNDGSGDMLADTVEIPISLGAFRTNQLKITNYEEIDNYNAEGNIIIELNNEAEKDYTDIRFSFDYEYGPGNKISAGSRVQFNSNSDRLTVTRESLVAVKVRMDEWLKNWLIDNVPDFTEDSTIDESKFVYMLNVNRNKNSINSNILLNDKNGKQYPFYIDLVERYTVILKEFKLL